MQTWPVIDDGKKTNKKQQNKKTKEITSEFHVNPSLRFPSVFPFIQTSTFNTVFNTVNQLTSIVG